MQTSVLTESTQLRDVIEKSKCSLICRFIVLILWTLGYHKPVCKLISQNPTSKPMNGLVLGAVNYGNWFSLMLFVEICDIKVNVIDDDEKSMSEYDWLTWKIERI